MILNFGQTCGQTSQFGTFWEVLGASEADVFVQIYSKLDFEILDIFGIFSGAFWALL